MARSVYLLFMAVALVWVTGRLEIFSIHAGDTREGWYAGIAAACALISALQHLERFVEAIRKGRASGQP